MAAIPPQQPGAQQPAIQQAGQLPAAQQPAAQQPAAQQPAAQQPAVQLPGAQTTAIPAAQPGIQPHAQTTDILAANPNPVKPETKADAKTETQAGLSLGLGGLTTSAPATSTVVKHKDVKPTPSLTEAATKARESASPTLSAEEMVTTVLDVAGKPTQQREGQYLTIFPSDFPREKWHPKAAKSVGKGYLFFQNQLGDNMALVAVVLAALSIFMAVLLVWTNRTEKKVDSYLPTEAKWTDGPDRLKKPLPRELRLQPRRSPPRRPPGPGGQRGGGGPPSRGLPASPFNRPQHNGYGGAGGHRGAGGYAGGGSRPPVPPPKYGQGQWAPGYAQPHDVLRHQQMNGRGGYATQQSQAHYGGYAPHSQLRRLPSQNQHGW